MGGNDGMQSRILESHTSASPRFLPDSSLVAAISAINMANRMHYGPGDHAELAGSGRHGDHGIPLPDCPAARTLTRTPP